MTLRDATGRETRPLQLGGFDGSTAERTVDVRHSRLDALESASLWLDTELPGSFDVASFEVEDAKAKKWTVFDATDWTTNSTGQPVRQLTARQ